MEWNIKELWDNYKRWIIHIFEMSKREEKEKRKEEICEVILAENFPKLMMDTKPQIQESQGIPSNINKYPTNYTWAYHSQTTEKSKSYNK